MTSQTTSGTKTVSLTYASPANNTKTEITISTLSSATKPNNTSATPLTTTGKASIQTRKPQRIYTLYDNTYRRTATTPCAAPYQRNHLNTATGDGSSTNQPMQKLFCQQCVKKTLEALLFTMTSSYDSATLFTEQRLLDMYRRRLTLHQTSSSTTGCQHGIKVRRTVYL